MDITHKIVLCGTGIGMGVGVWEVVLEGEREEAGAVVCMCEGEGIKVVDNVVNRVEKCGVRGGEKA